MKKICLTAAALTFCMGGISFSTEGMQLKKDGKYNEQNQVIRSNTIRPYLCIREKTAKKLKYTSLITTNYTCGNDDDTLHVRNFFQNLYYTIEGWYIKTLVFDVVNSSNSKIPSRNLKREALLCDCKTVEKVIIPKSFTEIGDRVFKKFKGLKEISWPCIEVIGNGAFEDCSSLKQVSLPLSVKSIGDYAFADSGLIAISMPNVTTIGASAFNNCRSLRRVSLSQKLKSIPNSVFEYCFNLAEITLPSSVTSIGNYAFNSSGVKEIAIPNVTTIGDFAFRNCRSLVKVSLSQELKSIPDGVFSSCSKLKHIEIPKKVTSINQYAFGNSSLTSISIPDGVTNIGHHAFFSCEHLQVVEILNPELFEILSIHNDEFYNTSPQLSIFIPYIEPKQKTKAIF